MSTFSARVFGDKLASILDALLVVQAEESAQFASGPVPLLWLFTSPTGESWYEADMLTRHYMSIDISLRIAMQKDANITKVFARDDVEGAYLSMLDVRQMLQARWRLFNESSAC